MYWPIVEDPQCLSSLYRKRRDNWEETMETKPHSAYNCASVCCEHEPTVAGQWYVTSASEKLKEIKLLQFAVRTVWTLIRWYSNQQVWSYQAGSVCLSVMPAFSIYTALMRSNSPKHSGCLHLIAVCTAWCSEIGSLWSLDAPELHASVMSENQFHCTKLYYAWASSVSLVSALLSEK